MNRNYKIFYLLYIKLLVIISVMKKVNNNYSRMDVTNIFVDMITIHNTI